MTEDDLRREFSFLWLGCLKMPWQDEAGQVRSCIDVGGQERTGSAKTNWGRDTQGEPPRELSYSRTAAVQSPLPWAWSLWHLIGDFFRTIFWLWKHDDVFDNAGFIYNNMKACTFSSSSSFTASISWREMKRNEDKANDKSHVNLNSRESNALIFATSCSCGKNLRSIMHTNDTTLLDPPQAQNFVRSFSWASRFFFRAASWQNHRDSCERKFVSFVWRTLQAFCISLAMPILQHQWLWLKENGNELFPVSEITTFLILCLCITHVISWYIM